MYNEMIQVILSILILLLAIAAIFVIIIEFRKKKDWNILRILGTIPVFFLWLQILIGNTLGYEDGGYLPIMLMIVVFIGINLLLSVVIHITQENKKP